MEDDLMGLMDIDEYESGEEVPLSKEGGFDDFITWFSKADFVDFDFTALKRSIATLAIKEFLADISFWFTNDGINISTATTSNSVVDIPWSAISGVLGQRVIIKKRIDDILENERLEADEDEIEHSYGEVDHACVV